MPEDCTKMYQYAEQLYKAFSVVHNNDDCGDYLKLQKLPANTYVTDVYEIFGEQNPK